MFKEVEVVGEAIITVDKPIGLSVVMTVFVFLLLCLKFT